MNETNVLFMLLDISINQYSKIRCEFLGPGFLVPRRNEPGFLQKIVQEMSDSVLSIFETLFIYFKNV